MRLATTPCLLTSRLAAAAIMLAAVSFAAPGHACDNDSKASTASSSSCGAKHGTSATTASMKKGAHAEEAGDCCAMKSSASAAKAAANCPMGGTAACPPEMCASKSASASTAHMKGACSGDAMTSGARKPATKVTRTAAATRKRALKAKPAAKPANGSTAVNVTPGSAGLVAVIDPETGGIVQATAEQLAQISASASKLPGGVSTQGRVPDAEIIALPGGGKMMRVPERLMLNATATRSANGKISYGCQQGNGPVAPVPAETPAAAPQSTWEVK